MPRAEKSRPEKHQKKARTPTSCVTGPDVIRLYVGTSPPFVIHEALASHHSEYFRRMFASNAFKESSTKEVHWDDEEVEVVRLMVKWFYFQFIDIEVSPAKSRGNGSKTNGEVNGRSGLVSGETKDDLAAGLIFRLWVLADKRGISALRNSAVTLCHKLMTDAEVGADKLSHPLGLMHAAWLFENTSEHAKVRDLVVDCIVLTTDVLDFNQQNHELPTSLSTKLIRRTALYHSLYPERKHRAEVFQTLYVCNYHEHPSGMDCRGKKLVEQRSNNLADAITDLRTVVCSMPVVAPVPD